MTKKGKKILILILVLFLIVIFAGVGYVYIRFGKGVPEMKGVVQLVGPQEKIEITFDKMDIPQIWAKSEQDVYFAMGYLHASQRLFQMDMTRRAAQGRLAELLGETVLPIDKHQRMVGHDRIARKYLERLSPENRARLEAYTRGVRSYVERCEVLPFEYQLLGQDFEPWTVYDCLTILSFQTWFSNFLMSPDEFRAKMFDQFGAGKIEDLKSAYPAWAPVTVPQPQEKPLSWREQIRRTMAEALTGNGRLPFLMSNSSNSWVVAPARSASGGAMLASDPHLETTRLPQFWYLAGLHAKDSGLNVVGITTPGLPFVIMGHNGKAAWAFTVSGIDVNEYYMEKINPKDSSQYLTPDGWKKFNTLRQEIRIAGKDQPEVFIVKETRHGPVVFSNDSLKRAYALHWAGYDTDLDRAFSAAFNLMTVSDYDAFRKNVTQLGALDASWTYADINGNIGYQLGTPVPIREFRSGNLPVPGWTDEYQWKGFYPLDKTPHSLNPKRGWLAVCNNKPDAQNLDYPLQGYFYSERILRITNLLSRKETFTVQDMYNYQMDITNDYVLRWKPEVIRLLKENGFGTLAERVARWQGEESDSSHIAALMEVFLNQLKRNMFEDETGLEQLKKISYPDMEAVYFGDSQAWFDNIRTKEVTETKETVAAKSIRQAVELTKDKTWGQVLTLTMQHPLAVAPIIGDLLPLSYGPFPWHGSNGTLNAAFYFSGKTPGQFESVVGPSWRFVIDFSDVDAATMIIPAGNSGHPFSEHFMDFFDLWRSGKRWNVPLSYDKVHRRAVNTLILKP